MIWITSNDTQHQLMSLKHMFLLVQSMYDLFTAYTVMCNSNTLLPIRAVPNMGFQYLAEYEYE